MFTDYRQEQQPDQLGTAEFIYNNKVHLSTKTLSFKANYRQDPRMGFEVRKKRKFKRVEKFVMKIKKTQEEAKAVLEKAQEKIKKYIDRKRAKVHEYKVGDLVMLSTKNLKYQTIKRRTEKLMERFVEPYKIKKIVLMNAVELELPATIKIHPVVNVSRIQRYVGQVEGQRKEQPVPVIIKEKEEQKIERILNKQQIKKKDKYLVQQKRFTAELDTWKEKKKLVNTKKAIEKFEKEYRRDIEDIRRQKREEEIFRKEELLGRFMVKKLYGQTDKRYDEEYWARLERNCRYWKGGPIREQRIIKTIKEKEEVIGQEESRLREWNEKEDEIGNIQDPYEEL